MMDNPGYSDERIDDLILGRNNKSFKRDKSENTPEFNAKWKKRRAKAKHDSKARKKNRKK